MHNLTHEVHNCDKKSLVHEMPNLILEVAGHDKICDRVTHAFCVTDQSCCLWSEAYREHSPSIW